MLYLRKAAPDDGRDIYDMLQRIGANENGFVNEVNGMDYGQFPGWLSRHADMSRGIGLEDWMVPATTFWLMHGDVPVGQGNLRHRLTDALRQEGGHIGYAIDASLRGRGYGKALLRLLLEEARRMGVTEELLVTVRIGNTASRRVAEACGGELRRETEERAYYWFQ